MITFSHNYWAVATKFHKVSLGNLIGFRGLVVDFLRRTVLQLVVEGKEAEGPVDGDGNAGKGEDGENCKHHGFDNLDGTLNLVHIILCVCLDLELKAGVC